jgi:predicted nuclease with TOPRIM domain
MKAQTELDPENESMSTVTLGDIQFDPVDTQDFRLSVEGTSGTGKSNTLAVILEDLADVSIPTLIIERLGALSTARLEDEDIVVVGAREEEGVDLAVALKDLDQLGSWVLDRGMKTLLDVSTYAEYEEKSSRVHEAAARAARSLNDRAHEKYRAGDRTKSLLVVDEAHYLAPKNSAPEPELDEHVKRCRGQLIKAATEGGNKGISIVVGYQRRAFLHNGMIQLCDDYIAHKPGDEDVDRTADALRCSEDELANLQTGEILARGESITDGDLVGPTKVRKRQSPDPREESFELPETPEQLSDVLEDIQEEVEAERERRSEREDEVERLREENERLREEKADLEEELANVDKLSDAMERLVGSGNGGVDAGAGAAAEVGEGVQELQSRVGELKQKRDRLQEELDDVQAERDELAEENEVLQERVADLEADVQELRSAFEGAREDIAALVETFDVDVNLASAAEGGTTTNNTGAEPAAAPAPAEGSIMAEFQEEAIDRIITIVGGLSERQCRLLKYIEAHGQTLSSQKAWAQRTLGLSSDPSGTHYEDMSELIDQEFVRKNKDGSIAPNVRGRVKDELGDYDVDDATIEETYQQVLAELAAN